MVRNPCALITDFDGTMTRTDFYELVVARCLSPSAPDYWSLYYSGKITHFEAMAGIYRHITWPESKVLELLKEMEPDPAIPEALALLETHGWDVAVVSNGSSWYIDKIFAGLGVDLPVHSNPGRFEDGAGLRLELPVNSPFFCPASGVEKAAVVRDALARYERVAFAGNGPPDLAPALLVSPGLRFARGWLADTLREQGERFRAFQCWSRIAVALTAGKELTA